MGAKSCSVGMHGQKLVKHVTLPKKIDGIFRDLGIIVNHCH